MRKILLYGELADKFGKEFLFDVKSVREAISLLQANFPTFNQHLIDADKRIAGYEVWSGDYNLSPDRLEDFSINGAGDIRIIPVIDGASAGARIVVGAILMAVGYVFTPVTAGGSLVLSSWGGAMMGMGASLVLGGVIELLSPKPHLNGISQSKDDAGYLFSGTLNSTKQGSPVGLGYGKMIVGSSVVSQSIAIEDLPIS